ncbi:MAG TPA: tetratricopeptide repeat protein [Bacteroidia bacterium]|nr:tetratricopeptide repeat protein [Bacteroidota bacterium]MCB8929749.1 tetratricopeptide repeat protein [Bacteroidia bacterium]MCE7954938.1 tetratricopeptide repeat protein [Bacteroidetes bacterium CHB6]MCB0849248.1 tetratricopeptide repeat protein [Bacteroidota bacterium]MCW5930837.1 tetratricopeptide repeat protein [Bacteroidota bacterium]
MRKNNLILLSFMLLIPFMGMAQNEKSLVRKGNRDYKKGDFSEAELQYRKSIEKNNKTQEGKFNLGDALYKQGKYDEAAGTFQNLSNEKPDKDLKAKSFYNQGNALLKAEKYQESANAYKESLKINPNDEDARYNYVYALSKLRQQQQQQQQQDKNKKDNKDKNKDQQKNQDKKDDKKNDKNQQQNQNQQQKDQKDQKEQAQQPKISKEDAERMLQAVNNDEKELQKKMAKKEGARVRIEKQW